MTTNGGISDGGHESCELFTTYFKSVYDEQTPGSQVSSRLTESSHCSRNLCIVHLSVDVVQQALKI